MPALYLSAGALIGSGAVGAAVSGAPWGSLIGIGAIIASIGAIIDRFN